MTNLRTKYRPTRNKQKANAASEVEKSVRIDEMGKLIDELSTGAVTPKEYSVRARELRKARLEWLKSKAKKAVASRAKSKRCVCSQSCSTD